ncbi:MAG: type II toxin-antitoxin system HicA family toxin [Tannerellaceae bacterium]|nr:type II toxin-antitoxin system HicA family toxin [Tannerellaceae bacterium]
MKYSEAERKLRRAGCYLIGERNGHPYWYSPITGQEFKMGHHHNTEMAKGTQKQISKLSGVKL